MLGVLRDSKTGLLIEPPQPTYDDVPRLVEAARAAGMRIDFHDRPARRSRRRRPGSAARCLRILQEGLTNAGNHAPGDAGLHLGAPAGPVEGVDVFVRNALGFARRGPVGPAWA